MATFVCPKRHESSEPDYCSECGARIEGAAAAPVTAPVAGLPENCPECGAAREPSEAVFCEICGYNFQTGAPGAAPAMPLAAAAPAVAVPAANPERWAVEVSADLSQREPGSPDPPADFVAFRLDLRPGPSLIGRRSNARAIYPEIDLSHDTAVSHRHALIEVNAAGAAFLRDIGAANGTKLNGKEVDQLKDHPLAPGDEIALGHWSRLVLKAED